MFRANVATPVFRTRGGGSSGVGLSLAVLGMMLLLLLLVVVIFLVVYLKKEKKKRMKSRMELLRELQEKIRERQESMYAAGEDAGINRQDLEDELFGSSNLVCHVYPTNNVCDPTFYDLKDGCCQLKNNASELNEQARREMIMNMIIVGGLSVLPEFIITRIMQSPQFRAAVSRLGSITSRALSKLMAKIIGRLSRMLMVRLAIKLAAMTVRLLTKLGSGPAGWALMVFELFMVIQDIADVDNYNSFIDNTMNLKARDKIIYEYHKLITTEGGEYPVLFPFASLFPEESEEAMSEYTTYMMTEYAGLMAEVEGGEEFLTNFIVNMMDAGEDAELDLSQEDDETLDTFVTNFLNLARERHSRDLDAKLFEYLQAAIPSNRRNDIVLIPDMSSTETIGIGVSEEAANRWNQDNENEWFDNLDPFFPPNRPSEDWVPPFMAVHTNKYLTPNMLNPGTENEPNIVVKNLSRKVTLAYPYAMLITNCEKPRTASRNARPIDPRKYDVTFDAETGVCNFTRSYCQRYGRDYKNKTWKDGTWYTNCDVSRGQEVAEAIIGTQNYRDIKLWFNDPEEYERNARERRRYLYEQRKDRHGQTTADILSIVDRDGFFEGFGRNMSDMVAGRKKYCDPADTCKEFHVKHMGGNFMTWTARDKDGNIYSNGQGYQNQVKHGEDHTFFVPEGGYFKADCVPGESTTVPYEDIVNPLQFSCHFGQIEEGGDSKNFFKSAGTAVQVGASMVKEELEDFAEDLVSDPGQAAETALGGLLPPGVDTDIIESGGETIVDCLKNPTHKKCKESAEDFGESFLGFIGI